MGLSRIRFLARVARRNTLRHKGQTTRAVLGLLVVTVILTMGLGIGESVGDSFERAALQRFGPIDVTLHAQQPIDQAIVEGLAEHSQHAGVQGAATLVLQGAVSNPRSGLAEPEATIRGVTTAEADALGRLEHAGEGGTAPEPGPGEAVVSEQLADVIGARTGDTLVLRTQKIASGPGEDTQAVEHTGIVGLPTGGATTHQIDVPTGTSRLVTEIQLPGNSGTVAATLRSPAGDEHTEQTTGTMLRIEIDGSIETGPWTLGIQATAPTNYSAHTHITRATPPTPQAVTIEAVIVAIVKTEGRAAITAQPTVLLALDELQRAADAPGRVNAGYFHSEGDAYDTAQALSAALPEHLRDTVRVGAEKAMAVENAKEESAILGAIVIAMGSFTLVAAVLLAYTMFSALVEARRSEIGIARALGMSRGEVALSMTFEGAIYGFAAAVVGAAVGLGLVALVAGMASGLCLDGNPYASSLGLSVSPITIVIAIAIGTLIPLITIAAGSIRFARVDPARAIRGVPDDPKSRRRTSLFWAAILLLVGLLLLLVHDARPLAIPFMAASAAVVAHALGRPSIGTLAAGTAVAYLVWSLYTFEYRHDEAEPVVVFASGAFLAFGLAALAVVSKRPYLGLLRLTGPSPGVWRSAFIGVRYLVARRRPVGLTISMIALVTLIVTVVGMLVVTAAGGDSIEEGGYQIVGDASTAHTGFPEPLPADVANDIARAEFLLSHLEMDTADVTRDGRPAGEVEEFFFAFLGVNAGFVAANEFVLDEGNGARAAAFGTDQEAWAAVLDGQGIIVPWWFLENDRLTLGETLTLQTSTFGPKDYVVVAGLQSDRFGGWIFISQDDVVQMGPPQGTEIMIRVTDGADDAHIAHRLSAVYAAYGLTFESIEEDNAQDQASVQLGVLIVEGFLAFGLFVGLSSTGFMASRAVHERRRDIGTLRALGYEEPDIRRAFMIESVVTAATGLLIGTVSGLVVAHSIWWRAIRPFGLDFQPPWLILLGISLAVLLVAVLASRGPARRAARLTPAMAVRHQE